MSELNQDYIEDLRREMVEAICKVSADRQGEGLLGEKKPSTSGRRKCVRRSPSCWPSFWRATRTSLPRAAYDR
jgi:hypothetical protein